MNQPTRIEVFNFFELEDSNQILDLQMNLAKARKQVLREREKDLDVEMMLNLPSGEYTFCEMEEFFDLEFFLLKTTISESLKNENWFEVLSHPIEIDCFCENIAEFRKAKDLINAQAYLTAIYFEKYRDALTHVFRTQDFQRVAKFLSYRFAFSDDCRLYLEENLSNLLIDFCNKFKSFTAVNQATFNDGHCLNSHWFYEVVNCVLVKNNSVAHSVVNCVLEEIRNGKFPDFVKNEMFEKLKLIQTNDQFKSNY